MPLPKVVPEPLLRHCWVAGATCRCRGGTVYLGRTHALGFQAHRQTSGGRVRLHVSEGDTTSGPDDSGSLPGRQARGDTRRCAGHACGKSQDKGRGVRVGRWSSRWWPCRAAPGGGGFGPGPPAGGAPPPPSLQVGWGSRVWFPTNGTGRPAPREPHTRQGPTAPRKAPNSRCERHRVTGLPTPHQAVR